MNAPAHAHLTGTLFAPKRETDVLPGFSELGNVNVHSSEVVYSGWTTFTWESPRPFLAEPAGLQGYNYRFFVRHSKRRFLLLAEHGVLVQELLRAGQLLPRLMAPTVNIPALVRDTVERPGRYVLSAVYARVEGFGQALRSIIFYGSDLGEADMFRSTISGCVAYRATLKDAAGSADTLSISARGDISFHYDGAGSLMHVDRALAHLSGRQYIQWDT